MTYEDLLYNLVQKDDRFIIMTAENRGPIRGLPEKIGHRFIDTGISEQTMIGLSAGLALRGRIPVVHALACFLTMRAFEFIRTDIGLGGLPVKLMGTLSGFQSEANGPTHQALEDIALMRGIPGMRIFCPSDEEDMLAGLPEILQSPYSWYIRYTNQKAKIKHSEFKLGQAEKIGSAGDICLISYGFMFNTSLAVKKELEEMGLSVTLINLRTLKPLDEDSLIHEIKKCKYIVSLEDHFKTGGLYSILCEILAVNQLSKPLEALALNEKWFKPGELNDVLEYEGFTPTQISKRILKRFDVL